MILDMSNEVLTVRIRELLARSFIHYSSCHMLREDNLHGSDLYDRERSAFETIICSRIPVLDALSSPTVDYTDEIRKHLPFRRLIELAAGHTIRLLPCSESNRRFALQDISDEDLLIPTEPVWPSRSMGFSETFLESVGRDTFIVWEKVPV